MQKVFDTRKGCRHLLFYLLSVVLLCMLLMNFAVLFLKSVLLMESAIFLLKVKQTNRKEN